MKIKYGQKVVATGRLTRTFRRPNRKEWVDWTPKSFGFEGLFLGYRNLSNGELIWDEDEGNIYYPKEHMKVALVSPNERENPVYVPLDKIKAEYS